MSLPCVGLSRLKEYTLGSEKTIGWILRLWMLWKVYYYLGIVYYYNPIFRIKEFVDELPDRSKVVVVRYKTFKWLLQVSR